MPDETAGARFAADLQITARCRDALAVFEPLEQHLPAKALRDRMIATHGVPYSLWSPEASATAMDPARRGVRPGHSGYTRRDLVDALSRVAGSWGTQ